MGSCSATGQNISQGSPRVGFEIWRVGRRCMTYQMPSAFLSRLILSVAGAGRSKCKLSGKQVRMGDLCVAFTAGGAKGETPTTQVCLLTEAAAFLLKVAAGAGVMFSPERLPGFAELVAADRQAVKKILSASPIAAALKKRPATSLVIP